MPHLNVMKPFLKTVYYVRLIYFGRFYQADSAVQAALVTLNVLLNEPIDVKYPEAFKSQSMLNSLLKQRLDNVVPVTAQGDVQ